MINTRSRLLEQSKVYYLGYVFYNNGLQIQKALASHVSKNGAPNQILILEHHPVFTLGRNANRYDIHANDELLYKLSIETHITDRGGQVTYHGPKQIVVYPICNLKNNKQNVKLFVHNLEEIMIRTAADFGIKAITLDKFPGIWVETARGQEKLGAIGLHIHKWVTTHGIAFNVAPDLAHFQLITPCGITDKNVCSLQSLLGDSVPKWDQVINRIHFHLVTILELASNIIIRPSPSISIFVWRYWKNGLEFLNLAQNSDYEPWSPSITDTIIDDEISMEVAAKNYLKKHIGLTENLTPMELNHTFLVNSSHSNDYTWEPIFNNATCFHVQVPNNCNINLSNTKYVDSRWCNFEESQKLSINGNSRSALILLNQKLNQLTQQPNLI